MNDYWIKFDIGFRMMPHFSAKHLILIYDVKIVPSTAVSNYKSLKKTESELRFFKEKRGICIEGTDRDIKQTLK